MKMDPHLDDTTLDHLVVEVVTLAGALPNTSENRETTVVSGDVVDQFHDNHGLPHSGTTEKADLSTLGIWGKKVHHLK